MTLGSGQSAGHKRRFEECERIFGNQQFYSIEELSDEDLLYGDHPLPGNENGSSNLERLDNIIIGLPLASATSVLTSSKASLKLSTNISSSNLVEFFLSTRWGNDERKALLSSQRLSFTLLQENEILLPLHSKSGRVDSYFPRLLSR